MLPKLIFLLVNKLESYSLKVNKQPLGAFWHVLKRIEWIWFKLIGEDTWWADTLWPFMIFADPVMK